MTTLQCRGGWLDGEKLNEPKGPQSFVLVASRKHPGLIGRYGLAMASGDPHLEWQGVLSQTEAALVVMPPSVPPDGLIEFMAQG
jgi:hypothetical protein